MSKEIKLRIIEAGNQAVEQLIKVAKEKIIKPDPDDDLAADRLKNAAATKKLCIFDAFEILKRIEEEREALEENNINTKVDTKQALPTRWIQSKDLQNEGQNSILYKVVEDYVPKNVLSNKNRNHSWLYGYNEKYDLIVISKSGQIGEILYISGLYIALPKQPKE